MTSSNIGFSGISCCAEGESDCSVDSCSTDESGSVHHQEAHYPLLEGNRSCQSYDCCLCCCVDKSGKVSVSEMLDILAQEIVNSHVNLNHANCDVGLAFVSNKSDGFSKLFTSPKKAIKHAVRSGSDVEFPTKCNLLLGDDFVPVIDSKDSFVVCKKCVAKVNTESTDDEESTSTLFPSRRASEISSSDSSDTVQGHSCCNINWKYILYSIIILIVKLGITTLVAFLIWHYCTGLM